jgi:single-strand DNA-binding protein
MNVFTFTGNLGNPAEQRFTGEGKSVVNFSVAVKSGYGKNAATTWVKCAMWGKQGEGALPYLTKGQMVAASGELSLREYESKGAKGFSLEVNVNSLTLCGGKPEPAQQHQEAKSRIPTQSASGGVMDDMADDLPFASSNVSHDLESRISRRMAKYK